MSWLTSEQALALLGTKSQTLYANVSRGRIRAKPDPADSRRSLYHGEDVERLASRHAGRRKAEAVAAQTIRWGDPVLPSAISTIIDGRLFYCGSDAAILAEEATLEEIAALLWGGDAPISITDRTEDRPAALSLEAGFVTLARRANMDLPSLGRASSALLPEAESVLMTLADALTPPVCGCALHERLAKGWGRPEANDCIRSALVLLADHELNASTFAARVTASTGATLSAAVLSGLATLTGPLHGGAWQGVQALIETARSIGAAQAVRRCLAQGTPLSAVGHRLYPDGDIRAVALMSRFTLPPIFAEVRNAAEDMVGEKVNIDFALAAMTATFNLPEHAPLIIFALARSVGWLAHAMEQAESGELIRPRARYVGRAPAVGSRDE
ncbi:MULTISPECIES: citrate synthase [unclassified Sinorhizobium]|uniref:citrate synthase n=1 Tax=unclassified Sinorhizobium TaxID=2613772 RepID=UPI003525BA4A